MQGVVGLNIHLTANLPRNLAVILHVDLLPGYSKNKLWTFLRRGVSKMYEYRVIVSVCSNNYVVCHWKCIPVFSFSALTLLVCLSGRASGL